MNVTESRGISRESGGLESLFAPVDPSPDGPRSIEAVGRRRGHDALASSSYQGSIVMVIPVTVAITVIRKPDLIGFSSLLGCPLLSWPTRGHVEERAALAASQVLGLALARYILAFPPMVLMGRDELVAFIGPTLQRYLVGELP